MGKSLTMFKIYLQSTFSGNKPEFWENNWSLGSISQAISFYDINPDRDILIAFFPSKVSLNKQVLM